MYTSEQFRTTCRAWRKSSSTCRAARCFRYAQPFQGRQRSAHDDRHDSDDDQQLEKRERAHTGTPRLAKRPANFRPFRLI